MKKIRKITAALLILLLLLSICACGEYQGAVNGGSNKNPDGSAEQPELDNDPTNDFTVRLRVNGEAYIPTTALNVYWNDGYSIHIAPVDSTGTATIDGLDGDYKVTLSVTPSGYAYNSNGYIATNDNRNIIIDMYDLNLVVGTGNGLYNCYMLNGTGVYSVTVREEEEDSDGDGSLIQNVYFEFAPQVSGTYTIESWADTALDEVNPICTAYLGSSAFKYGAYTVTDVGECGSFTRNFVHTIEIADEMISSGGSQTFTFAVSAETKSGIYPVTYTFAVKRDGGFDLNFTEKTTVIPEQDWSHFDFDAFNALAGGTIKSAATIYPGTTNALVFDEDNYKVWEISEGGDGVYHVYDKEKYPETDGYGPVLVAYMTEVNDYMPAAFSEIDTLGYGTLTKVMSKYNYKIFIEGIKAAAEQGYYCVSNCPCHTDGSLAVCVNGCENCVSTCTTCPESYLSVEGYVSLCNADGVAPVTPEVALFLQRMAIGQRYFADGDGFIDSQNVDAYEDSQWLYACGYYER